MKSGGFASSRHTTRAAKLFGTLMRKYVKRGDSICVILYIGPLPYCMKLKYPIIGKGHEFGEVFEYITAAISGVETLWKDIENM